MGLARFTSTTIAIGALLALTAGPAHAQRCVAAGDMADNAAQNRYCGTSLITTTLGGAPLGGTAGFGSDSSCLSQNDDGSGPRIDITPYFGAAGLRFFTRSHTALYVNTNGNITFSGPVSTYTPDAFPVADQPMIAPFWADVDTRRADGTCSESVGLTCTVCSPCYATPSNQVWWSFEAPTATTPARAIFTWDEVGYYSCHDDRRQSFQLILTEAPGCGDGDFDVEFRYNRCEWDTGDASGGSGGFYTGSFGNPAQAGFDAGDGVNFVEIMSSRVTREINRTLCEESNVGEPGVWRFQIRSGAVMCPEAGMPCDTGMMGACGEGRISCDCSGASCTTSCVPQFTAHAERCNGVDDDCDGTADDTGEGAICPTDQMCIRGRCVARCFEGGCDTGYECTTDGCVEAACVGIDCPAGQRCRGGSCVPACDGVVCPEPLTCIAGACVDTCAGITCDDCTTCEGGSCVARCDRGATCGAGESCDTSTGRCVASDCLGVSCSAGTVCRGGSCVDACAGATCPEGDMCTAGTCVPIPMVDAGVPMPVDAAGVDASAPSDDSGMGSFDAGIDGGRRPPRGTGGGCCTVGAGADRRPHEGAIAFSVLALAIVVGRGARARSRRAGARGRQGSERASR